MKTNTYSGGKKMKVLRKPISVASALLIMILCIGLFACEDISDPKTYVENVIVTSETEMTSQYLFSSPSNTERTSLVVTDSYKDDEYYYYCVDLGIVKNVPVTTPQIYEYKTSATYHQTYTYTTINTRSIEKSTSTITSRLKYDNPIAGFNIANEAELGVFELFNAKVGYEFGMQFNSNSLTTTNSSSYINKDEESNSETKTVELTFDSSCQQGYYRICYARHYYIYAYITVDKATGEYTCDYVPVPQQANRLVFEYSFKDFEESRKIDGFNFDEQRIADLPIPTKYASDNKSTNSPVIELEIPQDFTLRPINRESVTLVDSTKDAYFEFDLSKVKQTMREYKLKIVKFSISMHIKEDDNGWQEVYLVNESSPNYNWKDGWHKFDNSILIYSKTNIETVPGKKGEGDFSVDIKKDYNYIDLADRLYLFCGAHSSSGWEWIGGGGNDKWTASNVVLKIYFDEK